jgi:hypothetical protein
MQENTPRTTLKVKKIITNYLTARLMNDEDSRYRRRRNSIQDAENDTKDDTN